MNNKEIAQMSDEEKRQFADEQLGDFEDDPEIISRSSENRPFFLADVRNKQTGELMRLIFPKDFEEVYDSLQKIGTNSLHDAEILHMHTSSEMLQHLLVEEKINWEMNNDFLVQMNIVFQKLDQLDLDELETFEALIDIQLILNVKDVMSFAENVDKFTLLSDIHDDYEYGKYIFESVSISDHWLKDELIDSIDFEKFGKLCRETDEVEITSCGYLLRDQNSGNFTRKWLEYAEKWIATDHERQSLNLEKENAELQFKSNFKNTTEEKIMTRLQTEICRLAKQNGYDFSEFDSENKLRLRHGEKFLFAVNDEGELSFPNEFAKNRKELNRAIQFAAEVMDAADYVYESEHAPPLVIDGLESDKYKLLSQFGDIVLAVRDDENLGFCFVTWETSDRGCTHGHYHDNNYTAAKEDFAVRAGLVSEYKVISREQEKTLSKAISYTLENGDLYPDEFQTLREIKQGLKQAYPPEQQTQDIEQSQEATQTQDPAEQEMQM
jgi:hypothetical protein